MFFGLPADVAGARYLYELVEQAFATETELFKRSELYTQHRSGDRRSATQSFQTGLAHGIARKLDELRRQRAETMRAATGRDLVPVKEGVVEDELAKLGLRFHARGGGRGRYVLREAYEAGHEAGERFEYRPGHRDGLSGGRTAHDDRRPPRRRHRAQALAADRHPPQGACCRWRTSR